MLLDEGDVLDRRLLESSLRRLAEIGYPPKGAVRLAPTSEDDHVLDLTIPVTERSAPRFGLGGTLGGIEGASFALAMAATNLRGCGEGAELEVQAGSNVRRLRAAVTKPYAFGTRWTAGLELDASRLDAQGAEPEKVPSYRDDRAMARARADFASSGPTTIALAYTFASIRTASRDDAPSRPALFGERRESAVAAAFVRDTIGACWRPRRGYRLGARLALMGGPLGGDLDLLETGAVAVTHLPHTSRTSLGARLQVAGLFPFGPTEWADVPYDRRYALGGPTEIRGYEPREIGPRDASGRVEGGDVMLLANVEYSLDLGPRLSIVAFFDAGDAVRRRAQPPRLSTSAGVEARVLLPVIELPFRLVHAWRLSGPLPGGSRFTLGLGTTFGR
jgi:outer membrane protein assembly factor BamA